MACFVCPANTFHAQVTNPKSIAFQPVSLDGQKVITAPVTNTPRPSYQPPLGMTAADVQRQVNENAMRNIGYPPPVIPPSDPMARHQFLLEQQRQNQTNKKQQQIAELHALLREDLPQVSNAAEAEWIKQTSHYRSAFNSLMNMHQGKEPFSIKHAVFLIENAWYNNTLSLTEFYKQVGTKASALKLLMKRENIHAGNNLGLNYLIQKLFTEKVEEYRDGKVYRVHQPLKYDFDDFSGEADWSKMFVSKLLKTGKGQCHSLPLLYLILAEEVGAQAWMSLAPEHSFIIFSDNQRRTFYNYETTCGSAVNPDWLMESGFINTTAIQNRIYLDTLGRNGLMATLIADLIMGYTNKFGYDTYMESMVDSLIAIHPLSLQGQMFRADLLTLKTKESIRKAGNPPLEKLNLYPEAFANYTAMIEQYDKIDQMGYVQMPKEDYERWLASLSEERRKQEKEQLKTQIKSNAKSK